MVSCELDEGAALLHLRSSTYFSMNATGGTIWELIQEPKTVAELCDAVAARYEVDPAVCYRDVVALLQQLADARLVEISQSEAG